MKIVVNAIPMTGLLTGIARHLRNLYSAIDLDCHRDPVRVAYFTGQTVTDRMPPLTDAGRRQKMSRSLGRLPHPVAFGLRSARWLKYEYSLDRACRKSLSNFSIYHETAFTPAKLTALPTVFSVYDLSLRRYRETHPRERVMLFEYFIKMRLGYANHILTSSEFVRQEVIDEFCLPASMVTAIPLAPDPLFSPSADSLVERVKLKYHLPRSYLLFVSSLEPRKNIDLLIEAMTIAHTDIPLVLVGWQGWGEKRWLEKIDRHNLNNRIYILGHVPDHDLKAIYTGAQALVYPSLYEGFGLPILEAMACRCPVICSDAASMPEVAGDAAILIDPAKGDQLALAIETIVHDRQTREELVRKGSAQAAEFSWDHTARQTLELFKRVQNDCC